MKKENVEEVNKKEMTQEAYLAKLQKEFADFKATLEGKSLEELKKLEQVIIKEIDDHNELIAKKEFDLPENDWKKISEGICKLLDKKGYTWQYAYGMVALYIYWEQKQRPKTIPYPVLDTTLNTLGGLEFKGSKEGRLCIEITNYIKPMRDEYAELRAKAFMLSEKHNEVLKALGLNTPVE